MKFSDLTPERKEEERRKLRDSDSYLDYDWYSAVFDDAYEVGKLLGIEITCKHARRHEVQIFFSGFCSQGDGASYSGTYAYVPDAVKEVTEYAPQDETLRALAEQLTVLQVKARMEIGTHLVASITERNGRHPQLDIEVYVEEEHETEVHYAIDTWPDREKELCSILRAFADWIYKQLEAEYDYQMSDEALDQYLEEEEFEPDEEEETKGSPCLAL